MAVFFDGNGGVCACARRKCSDECLTYRNFKPKPITHFDEIKAMSVEELAEFMNCGACPPGKDVSELCHDEDGGSVPDMCNLCWFNWLKQEASDG